MSASRPELPFIQAHLRAHLCLRRTVVARLRSFPAIAQAGGFHRQTAGLPTPTAPSIRSPPPRSRRARPAPSASTRSSPHLPARPRLWRDLEPGAAIEMREGLRVVGTATEDEPLPAVDPAPERRPKEALVRGD